MKIFVISDTHGKIGKVREVWDKLTNVDLVIHLGDYNRGHQAFRTGAGDGSDRS